MTYRGEDRRGAALRGSERLRGAFGLALVATVVAAGAIVAVSSLGTGSVRSYHLAEGVAVCLFAVAASLCWLRWRLDGASRSLWAGAALAFVGPAALVAQSAGAGDASPALARSAAVAVLATGILALGRGAVAPAVDASARAWRTMGRLVALAAAAAAAMHALGVAPASPRLDVVPDVAVHVVLAAAWAGVALLVAARSRQAGPLLAWLGLAAVVLALRHGIAAGAAVDEEDLQHAYVGLWLLAGLLSCLGAARDLAFGYASQRRALHTSTIAERAAVARAAAVESALAARSHDAINALTSIAGATQVLERYHAELPPETREKLRAGMTREIGRLQRLVVDDLGSGPAAAPGGDDAEDVLEVPDGGAAGGPAPGTWRRVRRRPRHGVAVDVDQFAGHGPGR